MELCTLYFADNYNDLVNTYRFRLIGNNLCQVILFLSTLVGYVFAQKFLNRAKFANEWNIFQSHVQNGKNSETTSRIPASHLPKAETHMASVNRQFLDKNKLKLNTSIS